MTCFYDRLEQRIAKCGNPVCMGMDPVLKLIPLEGTPEDRIKRFYSDILECCLKRNVQPAVVKPNSAYYECVSVQSMLVLQQLIADYRSAGIPVILDAKRGDIGKSSAAYANAAYDVYRADAVTVSPWMGADSVGPFIREDSENGAYVLLRTSNKGAHDFQDLPVTRSDDRNGMLTRVTSVPLSVQPTRKNWKRLRLTPLPTSTKSRSSFRACPFRACRAVRAAMPRRFSRLSKTVAASASSMCSTRAVDSTLHGSVTIRRQTMRTIASMHSKNSQRLV